jgi:hypothetical protein
MFTTDPSIGVEVGVGGIGVAVGVAVGVGVSVGVAVGVDVGVEVGVGGIGVTVGVAVGVGVGCGSVNIKYSLLPTLIYSSLPTIIGLINTSSTGDGVGVAVGVGVGVDVGVGVGVVAGENKIILNNSSINKLYGPELTTPLEMLTFSVIRPKEGW